MVHGVGWISGGGHVAALPRNPTHIGGRRMETLQAHPRVIQGVHRREVLKAGLTAGVALSAWSLPLPSGLWGAEAGLPKRGGILRVKGYDPIHFDHQLVANFKNFSTVSFIYSRLLRHKV